MTSTSSSFSGKTIAAVLVVTVVVVGFWMLLLGPKRSESSELGLEVEHQQAALAQAQSQVAEASTAKAEFPNDYRQLVTLGKAVPAGEETPSLIVQVNRVADRAGVKFDTLQLNSTGGEEATPASTGTLAPEVGPSNSVPASATVPPTEAEASLLPLGATIGSAGLGVMPYTLNFTGSFFKIADFIHGMDSLIHAGDGHLGVDGRLVTLDGFSLSAGADAKFPELDANFAVTTYVLPAEQGLVAGATATSPAVPAETAASTTTATPSSYQTQEAR